MAIDLKALAGCDASSPCQLSCQNPSVVELVEAGLSRDEIATQQGLGVVHAASKQPLGGA